MELINLAGFVEQERLVCLITAFKKTRKTSGGVEWGPRTGRVSVSVSFQRWRGAATMLTLNSLPLKFAKPLIARSFIMG